METLLGHLAEVKLLLDLQNVGATYGLTEKRILRRLSLVLSNDIGNILAEGKESSEWTTFKNKLVFSIWYDLNR